MNKGRMLAVVIGLSFAGSARVDLARASTPSFYPTPKSGNFPKKISEQKRIDLIDQRRAKKVLKVSNAIKIPSWEKFRKPRWRGCK